MEYTDVINPADFAIAIIGNDEAVEGYQPLPAGDEAIFQVYGMTDPIPIDSLRLVYDIHDPLAPHMEDYIHYLSEVVNEDIGLTYETTFNDVTSAHAAEALYRLIESSNNPDFD